MEIKIIKFDTHESGKMLGFMDVQIVDLGLTICGCKLFENDKGRWISLPDNEYTNKSGERRWQSFLKFDTDNGKEFQHVTKAALGLHLGSDTTTPESEKPLPPDLPPVEDLDIPF